MSAKIHISMVSGGLLLNGGWNDQETETEGTITWWRNHGDGKQEIACEAEHSSAWLRKFGSNGEKISDEKYVTLEHALMSADSGDQFGLQTE